MNQSRGPIIAAVVLLVVPALYVGSYLAMVIPGAAMPYVGGSEAAQWFFWPIEQLDRKLRPGAWLYAAAGSYAASFAEAHQGAVVAGDEQLAVGR